MDVHRNQKKGRNKKPLSERNERQEGITERGEATDWTNEKPRHRLGRRAERIKMGNGWRVTSPSGESGRADP